MKLQNVAAALVIAAMLISFPLSAATTPNVVIEHIEDLYRFIPTKDGSGIEKITHTSKVTYRANRAGDVAMTLAYYNDFITLDKASGGTTKYGNLNSDFFHNDAKGCIIKVNLKEKGSKGKAEYRRTFTRPEFLTRIHLNDIYDIESGEVRVEMPASLASRFKLSTLHTTPSTVERVTETKGKNVVEVFKIHNLKSPKSFSDDLPGSMSNPQIVVSGHFSDVDDLYRFILNRYIDHTDPGDAEVEALSRSLTEGLGSDSEKIDAITDYVHNNIRYLAVEHGDYGHRPDKPSEVLRKRFGDCKGSAALLRALMRHAGLDARLVWIGTPDVGTDWSTHPDITSGNHMIAAVLTGDSIMYIDGTAKFVPAGVPPTTLWGQEAMIEDSSERCMLRRVPVYPATLNSRRDSASLTIDPEKLTMSVTGKIMLTGRNHYNWMNRMENTSPAKRDESTHAYFGSIVGGCYKSNATAFSSRTSTVIIGTATAKGTITSTGDELYVNMDPAPGIAGMKFDMDERETGGDFGSVSHSDYALQLEVPEGMSIAELPMEVDIDNEWMTARLTATASADGRSITRNLQMTKKQRFIPFDKLESVNKSLQRLARACSSQAILKRN